MWDRYDILVSLACNIIGATVGVFLWNWARRGYETRRVLHGAVCVYHVVAVGFLLDTLRDRADDDVARSAAFVAMGTFEGYGRDGHEWRCAGEGASARYGRFKLLFRPSEIRMQYESTPRASGSV